jgi:hypothetical protein
MSLIALLLLSLLSLSTPLPTSLSDTITKCPRITCSEPLGPNVCFLHSGDNPVSWLRYQPCPSGTLCPGEDELAFFDTERQWILGSSDPLKSPTFRKLTHATCQPLSFYQKELLPGRKCTSNYQCQSFVCEDLRCKGLPSGHTCSTHSQCDVGLACIAHDTFPFATVCDSLKRLGTQCEGDIEC